MLIILNDVTAKEIALPVNAREIAAAAERIERYIHRTPLLVNGSVARRYGAPLWLKAENLQRGGSFKLRGALNALLQLPEEQRRRGVVAFSSGNHAQGVALAARELAIPATIVMPERAVRAKVEATLGYGATVVQQGVTESNRDEFAKRIAEESGATIIPPFDHPHIIAGAGTTALEILRDLPEIRNIVVPLGGGGLLSGCAVAAAEKGVKVWGVEPAAGDDGRQSFESGSIVKIDTPDTIADGARTLAIGENNFAIIRALVSGIATVTDDELLEVTRFLVTRSKLLVEPTGALGVAALFTGKLRLEGPTAVILSGGNADLSVLAG